MPAKFRVVTIFALLHFIPQQKYAPTPTNALFYLYICNLSEVDIFFPKSSLPIFVVDVTI
jgi:hypothetical protein